MTRLLIVEQDPAIRRNLTISFRARHFDVDVAADGGSALDLLAAKPSVIITCLKLPDLDGIELIGELRARTCAPIIVASSRQGPHHKIDALDAGADDYVTKPFNLEELVARVRAALRRPALATSGSPIVETDSFVLDLEAKRAVRHAEAVSLSPTEWHLAEALVRRPGVLVPSAELLSEVWGPASATQTHLLRIHIGHLRHKLEDDAANPRHFITVPGLGYRIEP
ncbi:MAG TPA: response regulator transcription factor [Propionibacteriaceae bacterium]|nr:response regulator transcription factor [Propionibacteriaceae bacterium]